MSDRVVSKRVDGGVNGLHCLTNRPVDHKVGDIIKRSRIAIDDHKLRTVTACHLRKTRGRVNDKRRSENEEDVTLP